MAYDPAAGTWHDVAEDVGQLCSRPAWEGQRVLAVAPGPALLALDPVADGWTLTPSSP